MRVYLDTLGCRLNQAEMGLWQEEFCTLGYTPAADPDAADVLVLNTCAVTREAARKSRQLIRRTRRANPRARLVVTGCYSTLEQQEAAAIDGVDLIVDNRDKETLVPRAVQGLVPEAHGEGGIGPARGRAMQGLTPRANADNERALAPGELKTTPRRAFVKVQDGCRHRCTFCVVTVARGAERDRSCAHIIAEIRRLQQRGVQEVVLSGVHLGGYGGENQSLDTLLGQILGNTDIPRLRLGSLEPWALSEPLLARFGNQRLLPHLHLPLQSGCDRTLKRMARQYRRADFARLLDNIRGLDPHFHISTDIIAGFPGESEADWQDSLSFIREMRFAHCHVFPYSPRPGTAAAQFTTQVPAQQRQARSRAARQLSAQMNREFLHKQIGRQSQVLWEGQNGDGHWQGYTENYLRAVLTHTPSASISRVALTATHKTDCLLARELS